MSCYNDDELTPPAWIEEEFLQDVLSQYEGKPVAEIIKFELSPASMKGDHYSTVMLRCKVEYKLDQLPKQTKQKSLIIKTIPSEEGMKRDLLLQSRVFENEISMYTKTLPKIEKILEQFGEPTKLSAGIVYHSLEPQKVIILEDLCELGYTAIRGRFLHEHELKATYTKLAKIHAVTYMLGLSEDHHLLTNYQDGFMSKKSPIFTEILNNGLRNFIDLLLSHKELNIYVDNIQVMQQEVEQACNDMFNAYSLNKGQSDDILVLNHGDFHIKNLMFKFNEANEMEDMIMVDFQGSCYAPSNLDMTYSQFLLLSPEMRTKRHEILHFYFTEFIRVLKKIDYQGKLPKYSQFQMSSLKYRHF
uniref:CHK kinase-like domain-containing protein n=1 Tax=Stomoxys calcitrans TaxID=35570 RepID=A0A1I8NX34_STOCA